ncbi:hypothetical protein, unlikely [Trypanosoma brucei gambiense DAL972]|uniref:Uncharacterized protein n=1 Tax=Trypanosoma brucei gambiense (strain MHOM/CI/86/DAL972) TaxID=679716 RepID=D0A9Y9_TRYB9|nr:hypothetical protein, unlikely [Trypanosoma brucei gambiense DAL972]CBH18490.1 hypothetical protein, unlikely [Trypanosoma brucei gambiense DAL972]|eukprot:XP_011780754.1 hypothetical protein, unlikely [Trypanosoma brucei gambiense DAL972]
MREVKTAELPTETTYCKARRKMLKIKCRGPFPHLVFALRFTVGHPLTPHLSVPYSRTTTNSTHGMFNVLISPLQTCPLNSFLPPPSIQCNPPLLEGEVHKSFPFNLGVTSDNREMQKNKQRILH